MLYPWFRSVEKRAEVVKPTSGALRWIGYEARTSRCGSAYKFEQQQIGFSNVPHRAQFNRKTAFRFSCQIWFRNMNAEDPQIWSPAAEDLQI